MQALLPSLINLPVISIYPPLTSYPCSVCCIYHKAKPKNFEDPFADSSDSSSSSSEGEDSSDGGEAESDGDVPSRKGEDRENDALSQTCSNGETVRKSKKHRHGAHCSHSQKKPPSNAYEHQPNYNKASSSKVKKSKGSSTMTVQQTTDE